MKNIILILSLFSLNIFCANIEELEEINSTPKFFSVLDKTQEISQSQWLLSFFRSPDKNLPESNAFLILEGLTSDTKLVYYRFSLKKSEKKNITNNQTLATVDFEEHSFSSREARDNLFKNQISRSTQRIKYICLNQKEAQDIINKVLKDKDSELFYLDSQEPFRKKQGDSYYSSCSWIREIFTENTNNDLEENWMRFYDQKNNCNLL